MSAADLRQRMAELELARIEQAEAERRKLEDEEMAQIRAFMEGGVSAEELERIRHRITVAVENGKAEIEVMRVPASLLTDKGRAVNNFDSAWPTTLTGKAAVLYRLYRERAAPLGYKLEARVLNYPGGKPGEVGLFLSWA
jgi:hypothetical protein